MSMNPAMMMARAQGFGELGATYNLTNNLPPGYYKDYSGNVIDPSGTIIAGPDVRYQTRPPSVDAIAAANAPQQLYTLPTGQQIALTPQQYQQMLAAQQTGNSSLFSAGASSSGLRIGGLNISWPMLFLIVGGVLLLQSRGLERRK